MRVSACGTAVRAQVLVHLIHGTEHHSTRYTNILTKSQLN